MKWILWAALLVVVIFVAMAASVYNRYRRMRKDMPKPAFKVPRLVPAIDAWDDSAVRITWIGHSTVYMNVHGLRIVTDPIFSRKAGVGIGPFKVGVSRHTAPALPLEQLRGKVDVILLSHAHLDHLDMPSLRFLASANVQVVTPANTGRLLRGLGFGKIIEMSRGDIAEVDTRLGTLTLSSIAVRHWGNRYPWNKDYGYNGYVFRHGDTRIVFGGDTAYTEAFQTVRDAYDSVDIAIMPIGAYSPDNFQRSHCTPEQAWEMFLDTGAQWLVPVHWDTFVLSKEPVNEPITRLLAAADSEADHIVIREHGQSFELPEVEGELDPEREGTRDGVDIRI